MSIEKVRLKNKHQEQLCKSPYTEEKVEYLIDYLKMERGMSDYDVIEKGRVRMDVGFMIIAIFITMVIAFFNQERMWWIFSTGIILYIIIEIKSAPNKMMRLAAKMIIKKLDEKASERQKYSNSMEQNELKIYERELSERWPIKE